MTTSSLRPEQEGPRFIDLELDVTEAAGLGEAAVIRATVALPRPDALGPHTVICFAQPGGGFNRRYFSLQLPSCEPGGQAAWHARRNWIFVALDPLGVGDSSLPAADTLSFPRVCSASHAAVQAVLTKLKTGTLATDFPAIAAPVVLGMGQSMGGALTLYQQAHFDSYDGVAILGFSAIHTVSRKLPGARPAPIPARVRDAPLQGGRDRPGAANRRLLELQAQSAHYPNPETTPPGWLYFFDDVPRDVVEWDQGLRGERPPWRSRTFPGLIESVTTPGVVAAEAASIVVPVLAAFGERDTAEDPRLECRAYRHAVDFSLFIAPRMGHMHNFASTRELLWTRIQRWGEQVAEFKQQLPENWPAQLFSDGV